MLDKLKQMMEFKQQADRIKRELENMRIEVSDVRNIKIVINGAQNFQAIEVSEELLGSQNKKKLEEELLRAINNAIGRAQAVGAKKMKDMVGLDMPGF